jgi:hypothetical protein
VRFYHHIAAFYTLKLWLIYTAFTASLHLPLWGTPDFSLFFPALVLWVLLIPLTFDALAPDQSTQAFW